MVQHGNGQYPYSKSQESLLARMKKIEGQARGIGKMIEEGRYCVDILQQLTALTSAANEVAFLILQGHIEGCVANAIREGKSEGRVKELMEVVRKAWR
ncbi:MAG: metal-sensitive transcriptional regulator [Dehalococcoidia bacterium]|nr:metal-sensitive transcriptional regulator [Dehalococcoidia bacterium]